MIDEYVLKIPLIGNHNTGKTTLVQRICSAGASSSAVAIGDTKPTVGVEFSSRVIKNLRPNTLVRLQLWDTAGTEKYAAIAAPVYRNAGGIIAVCDVTSMESLDALVSKWLPRVFEHLPTLPMTSILVICNKCDLVGIGDGGGGGRKKQSQPPMVAAFTPIEVSEALEAAGFKGTLVMEGSALTGSNIESAVSLLCNRIITKFADVASVGVGAKGGEATAGASMPKGAAASATANRAARKTGDTAAAATNDAGGAATKGGTAEAAGAGDASAADQQQQQQHRQRRAGSVAPSNGSQDTDSNNATAAAGVARSFNVGKGEASGGVGGGGAVLPNDANRVDLADAADLGLGSTGKKEGQQQRRGVCPC